MRKDRSWPVEVRLEGQTFPSGQAVRPGGELSGVSETDRVTVRVDFKGFDSKDKLFQRVLPEFRELIGAEWITAAPGSVHTFIPVADADLPEHLRTAVHEPEGNPDEIGHNPGPGFEPPAPKGWQDPLVIPQSE